MSRYSDMKDEIGDVVDKLIFAVDQKRAVSANNTNNSISVTDNSIDKFYHQCTDNDLNAYFKTQLKDTYPLTNSFTIQLQSINHNEVSKIILENFTCVTTGSPGCFFGVNKQQPDVGIFQFYYNKNRNFPKLDCTISNKNVDGYIFSKNLIEALFEQYTDKTKLIRVDWFTKNDVIEISDNFNQEIHSEFYPTLPDIDTFCNNFLKAKENVLILKSPPGLGKTTLIREICNRICLNELDRIIYASDAGVIEQDTIFLHYVSVAHYKAMVLEDIDLHLTERSDGNTFMYKLLGASDGIIRNFNKKIIISTNIQKITDFDSALLRPGRCWGVIELRNLSAEEGQKALAKIGKSHIKLENRKQGYTVAELYAM